MTVATIPPARAEDTDSKKSSPQYLARIGSITLDGVEGRLDHLSADPKSGRLFIACLENHSVEVLDIAKRQRIHSISAIKEPQGILFEAGSGTLFVGSRGDGTCRSFDANSFEEGPWVDLGRNADNVRFDKTSDTVYVGSGNEPGPGLISAIELASLLPAKEGGKQFPPRSPADLLPNHPRQAGAKAEVTLEAHPESFQVDSRAHRVYVNVPNVHQIAVLDAKGGSLSVSATWSVSAAEKNFPMALDTDSSRLFVGCRRPACVLVYDTQSGTVVSNVPCVGDADDVFYDASSKRLYVIGGEGFVDVFGVNAGGSPLTRLARVPTAPRARTGLFIPELKILAVSAPHVNTDAACILLYRTGQGLTE